jgi:hypothetical protein
MAAAVVQGLSTGSVGRWPIRLLCFAPLRRRILQRGTGTALFSCVCIDAAKIAFVSVSTQGSTLWVCAEPCRFRTSDNSDERFHVQRNPRRSRTSHRTSRNGTGKSARHSAEANPVHRAGQKLPATSGSVVAHSSARNARVSVSPGVQRSGRRQCHYASYRQAVARPRRPASAACCSSWRAAPFPSLV